MLLLEGKRWGITLQKKETLRGLLSTDCCVMGAGESSVMPLHGGLPVRASSPAVGWFLTSPPARARYFQEAHIRIPHPPSVLIPQSPEPVRKSSCSHPRGEREGNVGCWRVRTHTASPTASLRLKSAGSDAKTTREPVPT